MAEAQEVTLTVQELEAAHLACFDLGPGYPQLAVPPYVQELYVDDRIEELSLYFAPYWTPKKQAMIDSELSAAVASFLSLVPERFDAIRATFSGSIALDRALTALLNQAQRAGSEGLDVITTTPSIDIMRLFLGERPRIRPIFVQSRLGGEMGALDVGAVLDAIHRCTATPSRSTLLLLTSPENPTGSVWSAADLRALAEACNEAGACILIDHTFLLAGVHDDVVPRIWDIAPSGCRWVAVWDTGKTFGLNEDKLGFIVTGTPQLTAAVDEAMAVTQFGVARRQKLFFAELVKRAVYYDHIDLLRATCRRNLAQIEEAIASSPIVVRTPEAGSMALLDWSELGVDDEQVRQRLLAVNIGAIAGNVFFHDAWKPRNYVRVALARDPEHFSSAMQSMLAEVAKWPSLEKPNAVASRRAASTSGRKRNAA